MTLLFLESLCCVISVSSFADFPLGWITYIFFLWCWNPVFICLDNRWYFWRDSGLQGMIGLRRGEIQTRLELESFWVECDRRSVRLPASKCQAGASQLWQETHSVCLRHLSSKLKAVLEPTSHCSLSAIHKLGRGEGWGWIFSTATEGQIN